MVICRHCEGRYRPEWLLLKRKTNMSQAPPRPTAQAGSVTDAEASPLEKIAAGLRAVIRRSRLEARRRTILLRELPAAEAKADTAARNRHDAGRAIQIPDFPSGEHRPTRSAAGASTGRRANHTAHPGDRRLDHCSASLRRQSCVSPRCRRIDPGRRPLRSSGSLEAPITVSRGL